MGWLNICQLAYFLKETIEFANSIRGQYIISQSLWYAINELKKVKKPYREESNIEDMKFLMDNLFDIFPTLKEQIHLAKGGL